MAKVLVYYAHPGHSYSRVNKSMAEAAQSLSQITFCDLYAEYPRFDIDVDQEQQRLIQHDVILFQHPLFWYSTPPIIKQWFDLVLEHGFAYGDGGDQLADKIMMNAISAAGPEEAYSKEGYQHFPLRTFLTPIEQTATLCRMKYSAPYVIYSALKAQFGGEISEHVDGYKRLLLAISEDGFDFAKAQETEVLHAKNLPILKGTTQ